MTDPHAALSSGAISDSQKSKNRSCSEPICWTYTSSNPGVGELADAVDVGLGVWPARHRLRYGGLGNQAGRLLEVGWGGQDLSELPRQLLIGPQVMGGAQAFRFRRRVADLETGLSGLSGTAGLPEFIEQLR
jgi:hypothetical protein